MSKEYEFFGFTIPGYMMDDLEAYIETGRGVGHFLTAVLENNLMKALDHADIHNRANLPAYGGYLYNKAPGGCYGSPELVKAWRAAGGLEGLEKAEEKGAT